MTMERIQKSHGRGKKVHPGWNQRYVPEGHHQQECGPRPYYH